MIPSIAPNSLSDLLSTYVRVGVLQVNGRLSSKEYVDRLLSSATVLCLPGLGYDTYRIFEALLAG